MDHPESGWMSMKPTSSSEDTKVLIVEGKTDRDRLLRVLDEPVDIVCTYGSLSYEKMESLLSLAHHDEVYILVDADYSGNRLRTELKHELPNAVHLYTQRRYREVAATPLPYLARILKNANFKVDTRFLSEEELHPLFRGNR